LNAISELVVPVVLADKHHCRQRRKIREKRLTTTMRLDGLRVPVASSYARAAIYGRIGVEYLPPAAGKWDTDPVTGP
jgi:hypothetical protein